MRLQRTIRVIIPKGGMFTWQPWSALRRSIFGRLVALLRYLNAAFAAALEDRDDDPGDEGGATIRNRAIYSMTNVPSASMRDLARRLLAVETASQKAAGSHAHAGVRVCEKLQISVIRFAGSDGFATLLRRALALARAENPTLLQTVKLKPDGSLDGCEALAVGGPEGAVALVAHLLGLLETFIGQPFTLRLVSQAWPDTPLDG